MTPFADLSYRTRSILLMTLMAIVMGLIIFNSYKTFSFSAGNSKQGVAHLRNLDLLRKYLNTLLDAETGQRGYLLTRKEEFLQPYDRALNRLQNEFRPQSMLNRMPYYTTEIGRLNVLTDSLMRHLSNSISAIREGGATIDVIGTSITGKELMDQIRNAIAQLYQKENEQLELLNASNEDQNKKVMIILIAATLISVVLLLGYYMLISQNTKLEARLNDELIEARLKTENAQRSRSRFLSTMSHELRTPMNGVLGMTSLLLQTPLNDEQKRFATTIHRSGVELLAVINDMIDLSKIESGSLTLEPSVVSLQELIEEVITLLTPGGNLFLRYEFADDVPSYIDTDPVRLRQVLINVIANVLKISGQPAALIRVKCRKREEKKCELVFEVIAKADAPANAPLQENGFSRMDISAGLGLSISTRLISLLGGSIKLDTNAKQGSTITFSIRTSGHTLTQIKPASTHDHQLDNDLAKEYPLHILAVDDNEMNQMVISSILSKLGYSAEIAGNGQVAYNMAIERSYDLIFMDLLMPVMDGFMASQRIREYHLNKGLPIIIGLTADALVREQEEWKQAGINDILTKPYKASEIQSVIKHWGARIGNRS